jgi:aspartate/methionine/tyrosine aminotransferase
MEGWRVGWAIAPAVINAAIQNIHVKLTDSAPAPFQEAALVALQSSPSFYAQLQQEYKERRDFVCSMLVQAGFSNFLKPQGSFFVFAQLPDKCPLNDVSKHSDPSILRSVS